MTNTDLFREPVNPAPCMTTIEKASAIIEAKAGQYQPKSELYYPVFRAKNGDYLEELEIDEKSNVCEDCYERATAYFRARRKAGAYKEDCDGQVAGIKLGLEQSPEKDSYTLCGFCFNHIETGMLFRDEQEVDHWLSLTDEAFKESLSDPMSCWEIHTMLTDVDAQEHILKALKVLAKRILKVLSVSKTGVDV